MNLQMKDIGIKKGEGKNKKENSELKEKKEYIHRAINFVLETQKRYGYKIPRKERRRLKENVDELMKNIPGNFPKFPEKFKYEIEEEISKYDLSEEEMKLAKNFNPLSDKKYIDYKKNCGEYEIQYDKAMKFWKEFSKDIFPCIFKKDEGIRMNIIKEFEREYISEIVGRIIGCSSNSKEDFKRIFKNVLKYDYDFNKLKS